MDAPSIMAALDGGLRSRHAAVRERWSVRSQHSLTTPDPSFGQELHRISLWGDSRQNGLFHSGRGQCADQEKRLKELNYDDIFSWIQTINAIKVFQSRTPSCSLGDVGHKCDFGGQASKQYPQ